MKPGQIISHYKILEKLGEGGMGVVYKARDSKLDRTVALKFLPFHFTDSEDSKERLIREAKTAATLNHPNICTIYSIDEYEGQHFISMEYIDGTTLRQKLKSGGLSLSTVYSYAKGVASALSAAHDKGIVHRDIKPENIMVDTEDRVKVTDFGLARINGTRNLTKSGGIVGTMAYMSPEQIQYGEADERSDLFSFGIVLYEMLTGIHPFEAEYEHATGFKLVNENPDPPSSIRSGIPPGIEDIVLRCLEKERDKRYRSAHDLTVELQGESSWPLKIAADKSVYGRSLIPAVTHIKQKPWFWIVAGILVLAIGGWYYTLDAGTDLPEEKYIAVLPFTNLSSETVPASMSDGMMEIVTSKITRMETGQGSLWVVPSSEIRGGQVTSPSDAIRLFGVNMAVTGSLQQVGDRFRLTINLVDGITLRQIRSEVIEREWGGTDFAQLQDDVVETLMGMLELELGPDDVQNILAGSSQNPRAYQLYIEGKGALSRFEDPEKIESAIALFREAIEIDRGYALAYAGLAEAYWRKYELTRDIQWTHLSRQYAGNAIELNDHIPEIYITVALLHNGMQQYGEALEILNRLKGSDAQLYAVLIERARAFEGMGQRDEAEENYLKAIEQKKNYWGGFHNLGLFYFRHGEMEKASEEFRKVTTLTPDNFRAFNNLGGVYLAMERIEEAINAFEQSLQIQPNQRALTNLGTAHFYQNNYPEAVKAYEQAVSLINTDYRTWGYLGYAYYRAGEGPTRVRRTMEKAIELAEQEREVTPDNPGLLIHLAGYHITIGNREEAKNLLEVVTSQRIQNPQLMSSIADLHEQLGDREAALYWLEEALRRGYRLFIIENLETMQDLLKDPRMIELREKYDQ